MAIRIAISGAQGVGKTTFCTDLTAALTQSRIPPPSIEVRGNVARALIAKGVASDARTSADEYPRYLEAHIKNLFEPSTADFVICERTIVDTLAYARLNGNLEANWLSFASTLVRFTAVQFSAYFFIPIEFALHGDGIRSTDVQYQRGLEQAIRSVLNDLAIDNWEVRGARVDRVQSALKFLTTARVL